VLELQLELELELELESCCLEVEQQRLCLVGLVGAIPLQRCQSSMERQVLVVSEQGDGGDTLKHQQ
jgi:hypothetical protein